MNIPTEWTFKSNEVAEGFDEHVREQLPWYDLATSAVTHFGRHYIPQNGIVYDIGASTGNIGNALRGTLERRNASLISVEESAAMVERFTGPGEIVQADVTEYDFKPFDFCVLFLVLMFIPINKRAELMQRLSQRIKPGGCIVVVDKINTPAGYYGTALRRLSMQWKMENGASSENIIKKELSLAGYQRPIDPAILPNAKQFFNLGEFAGWVVESRASEVYTDDFLGKLGRTV